MLKRVAGQNYVTHAMACSGISGSSSFAIRLPYLRCQSDVFLLILGLILLCCIISAREQSSEVPQLPELTFLRSLNLHVVKHGVLPSPSSWMRVWRGDGDASLYLSMRHQLAPISLLSL